MHQNKSFFQKNFYFTFCTYLLHFLHLCITSAHKKNDEQLRSHQASLRKIVNVMPQAAAGLVAAGCLLGN